MDTLEHTLLKFAESQEFFCDDEAHQYAQAAGGLNVSLRDTQSALKQMADEGKIGRFIDRVFVLYHP